MSTTFLVLFQEYSEIMAKNCDFFTTVVYKTPPPAVEIPSETSYKISDGLKKLE